METTYRPRRSEIYAALACLGLFLVWMAALVGFAWSETQSRTRAEGMALMAVLPASMACLAAWSLAWTLRASLTFRGSRVASQGVFRRVEIDLADVVEARWSVRDRIVVRDASTRLAVSFEPFEKDDHDAIVARFRDAIPAEVQHGWNLFAYKRRFGLPKVRTEPGPGEILAGRGRWAWVFVPAMLATAVVAGVVWWLTGQASVFAGVPVFGVLWLVIRAMTPAKGRVESVVSIRSNLELTRPVAYIACWVLMGTLGIAALEWFWDDIPMPEVLGGVGLVLWFAVLLLIAHRQDRRTARRDREAADRAAVEREDIR